MGKRTWWSLLGLFTLLFGFLPGVASGAAPDWSKVDPALLDRLDKEGEATFYVILSAQADLSAAAYLDTKAERATYVFQQLRAVAEQTQPPLIRYLEAQSVPYRSFYIQNMIRVHAGRPVVEWLATRPEVARIVSPPDARPEPVERSVTPTQRAAGIEWNVARIHAPEAWAMGATGQGMVVASNDTGVEYTHPALINKYRGNLGGGVFDHNYNWWNGLGDPFPHDSDGHGTHTTGTMVGDDGGPNQIGVAPGAKWIACGGLANVDPVECFEFFLAPWNLQGQNPDPAKAPDAINNSWYDPSGFDYRPIIQTLNAAGIAVIKSAGNQGPGCSTITNPGYVPEIIATGAFAQGDVIASFSSRGPSSYYGETIVKPNVAAPGVSVRSSIPGGGYTYYSGTSMAAPHTTALVALVWSAASCLQGNVPLTKQIIEESAEPRIDPQCPPFVNRPNDVWGWGILDAQAAVAAAVAYCGEHGRLEGHVTEATPLNAPGDPLPDITVVAEKVGGGSWSTTTDASGYYSLTLSAGVYTVTASGPQHTAQTVTGVQVLTGSVTTLDFQLVPKGLLFGYVTDADSGAPLAATVSVQGVGSVATDPETGYYEIYLDEGTYTVTASAPDYISETATVVVPAGAPVQQDFSLLALVAIVPSPIQATAVLYQSTTVPATLLNHMAVPYPFQFYEQELRTTQEAAPDHSGGPDPFGYTFVDSNEPGGARYNWIDATDGTPLNLGDDDEANVTLPFAFTFYGVSSTAIRVGNNGGLIFNATTGDLPFTNADLGTTTYNNLIVPFWDDIDSDAGNVYYKVVGTPPYRIFVLEWYDRPHFSNVGDATFELLLYETTNNIKFQYQDVVFGNTLYDYGASATVGIRQSGNNYLQYSYNQPVLSDGLAICFRYPGSPPCDPLDVPWFGTSIASGTVPAGGSLSWTNAFTASPDLGVAQPGVYRALLLVQPTESGLPAKNVPVVLNVLPTPTMGHLVGTVTSDRPGGPLQAQILIEGSGGVTYTVATDPETGFYGYWLEEGIYTVTAAAEGYVSQTVTVGITAQQTTTQDFELALLAPWIVVTPGALEQELMLGETATQTLTVANPGLLPLEFRFYEGRATYAPLPGVEANPILLMGDDLTASAWDTYRIALAEAGVTWDEWNLDTQPFPTAAQLAPYDLLIWADEDVLTPGDAECQIVADWLQSGGRALFAAGRDFLWDLQNGTPGAGEHNLYLLFNTTYMGDYAGSTIATLDGVPGDIIGGDFAPPNGLALAMTLDSNGDYANEAVGAPTGLIYGPGGAGSGHSGLTHYEGSNYKTVWLGVNFHDGLTLQEQRNALMENILGFLIGLDVPWLSEEPITGTVAPGEMVEVTVTFDASALESPGVYGAQLNVTSNDPLQRRLAVPVTMTVHPSAEMGELEGTVTGRGYCDGDSYPLEATILIQASDGTTWTVSTDPNTGFYSRWLVEGSYTVTASAEEHLTATAVVEVIAQQTTVQDFALRLEAPCLAVAPAGFTLTLPVNARATETLSLANSGAGALTWELHETTETLRYVGREVTLHVPATTSPANPASRSGSRSYPEREFSVHVGWVSQQPIDVLLVTPDVVGGGNISLLLNTLAAFPDLNVTLWDANAGTPTVADMLAYDVVFVGNDILWTTSAIDKTLLSNRLADYIDAGGKVLAGNYVWSFDDWGFLGGRFITEDYSPYEIATMDIWGAATLGNFDPTHPIMAGITSATDNFGHQNQALSSNGTWVASWNDGRNFVAVSPNCVGLNQEYFHNAAFGGQVGEILHNALRYLSAPGWTDVPWVSEVPTSGVVLPDSVAEVQVVFDATGLTPGECYDARLALVHNDSGQPSPYYIPLHLCVSACQQVTGVELSVVTTGTILPGQLVTFRADIAPDDATKPYSYTVNAGPPMSSSDDPLFFDLTFGSPGAHPVTIAVWNCGMPTPVTDSVVVQVWYRVYLPLVFKGRAP